MAAPEVFPRRRQYWQTRNAPKWTKSWLRLIFPGVFLIYVLQTVSGAFDHSDGIWTALGLVALAAFCVCYLGAVADGTAGRYGRFWYWYLGMVALFVVELPIAHQDAMPMLTYIAVLTVASRFGRGLPILAVLVALPLVLPPLIKPWHAGAQGATALSIAIVSLAMFAFFGVIRSNDALEEARAEVARLAAEGERTRIARDLHDLLGHSLTTITVKAELAKRLAERDPDRAAIEIGEVEQLARQTLTDVRAAVAGYREVSLGSELAAAREVLRAAGITAVIPGAIDSVTPQQNELFAWVVREGVTNVVRHSRARTCEIRLAPGSIEIIDDGIGCTGPAATNGNGLTGLRERVDEAGGKLTVDADQDGQRGWQVRVEVPA
jgi:two-component system, NarL family, sensor histidine kinase DesK